MVHFEFGQNRLTQSHPLNAFELAQGAIKVPFERRFVTQQMIELRCKRNVLPKRHQLHPLRFHRGAGCLGSGQAAWGFRSSPNVSCRSFRM